MLRREYTTVCCHCQPLNSNKPQKTAVSLVEISAGQLNQRLDNFLFKQLGNVPRTRIYRIIRKGEVRVNKKRCKPDYKLQIGDQVRIPPLHIVDEKPRKTRPPRTLLERLAHAILYENNNLLIIDKPAGLAVHGGSGIDYGVIDAMRLLYPQDEIELVHRLDRDTSGCLLLAKNRPALLGLQTQLKSGQIEKNYLAVVQGHWPRDLHEIDLPLKKYILSNGERRVRVDAAGKTARSRFSLMALGKSYSVLRVGLVTGRTHQIRVHCQSQGHALAGDEKYGNDEFNRDMRKLGARRLMLHAASLELPISDYTSEVVINAPVPEEFERLLASARVL